MDKDIIIKLFEKKEYKAIKSIFDTMNPVDTATLLPEFDEKEMVLLFRLIPKENAAMVFTYLEADSQQVLLEAFTDKELKHIMDEMFIDDAVDVIEEMPANVVSRMLSAAGDKRESINQILNYPEDSAGSIMTLEYITLLPTMTIGDALKKIKSIGAKFETVYTCYVVEKHKLLGIVTAKELLTQDDSITISDVMETNIITVNTHADKEEVANLLNKYDFLALPVVDVENCMVGIVTIDDAMDVILEEAEEDIQMMSGITPTDKPFLKTSVFEIFRTRIPWLLILMLSSTFTGIIISSFETALEKLVVLTAFIPMIMGTGGNSGSQASVTVIRGLSLGEVDIKDVMKVLWKELRVSILCGVVIAVATFLKVYFIDGFVMGTENVSLVVSMVVALTLCVTVIAAKLIGCVLPLLAKKMGFDPAVMASPFITTLVDAISLLVYFGIAKAFLPI
ncbi:MAG: magnesium transporter [Clostridia bacterium]|nr:magnesium transporter [Clostridia bacterium]MBR3809039.1 magnesium transporter [Clostridia bacterium]